MALTATLYRFQLELADIDRGVYESLELRVACHPSEDAERVVVRVLARALAHEDGLEFGRGLSHAEDPALWTQNAAGVKTWIDVGAPSAERLHRASKRAERVLVFTNKVPDSLRKEWSSRTIHQADELEIVTLPAPLVQQLAAALDRNMTWYVTLNEGVLSVGDGEQSIEGPILRQSLADYLAGS